MYRQGLIDEGVCDGAALSGLTITILVAGNYLFCDLKSRDGV